jgi:hypothetical protein
MKKVFLGFIAICLCLPCFIGVQSVIAQDVISFEPVRQEAQVIRGGPVSTVVGELGLVRSVLLIRETKMQHDSSSLCGRCHVAKVNPVEEDSFLHYGRDPTSTLTPSGSTPIDDPTWLEVARSGSPYGNADPDFLLSG